MQNKNKAFTLLELLISITIAAILMMMAYAPYNYYTNKAKVKLTGKEISQILANSRNMAVHGVDSFSGNVDIGVKFNSGSSVIDIYSFPYDSLDKTPDSVYKNFIQKIDLRKGMQIDTDAWFLYSAISGSGIFEPIDNFKIIINYSFKGSSDLAGKLTYYTLTNVSDY